MAPLHSACFRGHADIVMMLLGAKADINAKTKVCSCFQAVF